jgi:hypothetical protein
MTAIQADGAPCETEDETVRYPMAERQGLVRASLDLTSLGTRYVRSEWIGAFG